MKHTVLHKIIYNKTTLGLLSEIQTKFFILIILHKICTKKFIYMVIVLCNIFFINIVTIRGIEVENIKNQFETEKQYFF